MSDALEVKEEDCLIDGYIEGADSEHQKLQQEEVATFYQKVAANMRHERLALDLTQRQLADEMNIPRSTYKSLESGTVGIYFYHMIRWSFATGLDIRLLTKGTHYDLSSKMNSHKLVSLIQALPKKKYDAILEILKK